MKRGIRIILLLILLITILSTFQTIYAWYVSSHQDSVIDVSTSTVDITLSSLSNISNSVPGDVICLNDKNTSSIFNKGTRNAIVEISFEDSLIAELDEKQVPYKELEKDYSFIDGRWIMNKERLKEIVKIEMTLDKWIKIGNNYYVIIPKKGSVEVDKIFLKLTGELGGNNKQKPTDKLTPERNFEQNIIFKVQYKTTAVQATKDAMINYFGDKIANSIPNQWYE